LLNSSGNDENQASANSIEGTFKELMQLCRGDITEIIAKMGQLAQNELREDKLRNEVIEQGKKMNELRADHERQMYELGQSNSLKIE